MEFDRSLHMYLVSSQYLENYIILVNRFSQIYNRVSALYYRQNFVSAQYLENKFAPAPMGRESIMSPTYGEGEILILGRIPLALA